MVNKCQPTALIPERSRGQVPQASRRRLGEATSTYKDLRCLPMSALLRMTEDSFLCWQSIIVLLWNVVPPVKWGESYLAPPTSGGHLRAQQIEEVRGAVRGVNIGWFYAVRIKFLMLTLLGFGIWALPNYYPYKMDDKMTLFSLQRQTPYYKACPVGFLLSPLQWEQKLAWSEWDAAWNQDLWGWSLCWYS